MLNSGDKTMRSVSGIKEPKQEQIRLFLKGAVYCWCKNNPDKWFSLRDLMGGENFYWEENPLFALWEKHKHKGEKEAVKSAGIDAGWLLKKVIIDDCRTFESRIEARTRQYLWVP